MSFGARRFSASEKESGRETVILIRTQTTAMFSLAGPADTIGIPCPGRFLAMDGALASAGLRRAVRSHPVVPPEIDIVGQVIKQVVLVLFVLPPAVIPVLRLGNPRK